MPRPKREVIIPPDGPIAQLWALQVRLELSDKAFAALFGVSYGALKKWLHGERAIPGTALRLLAVYGALEAVSPALLSIMVTEVTR